MSSADHPSPLRVLIAGGGVAGLEAILALRELAAERVSIELLTPEADFVYRPASVAEPFGLGVARRFGLAGFAADRGIQHRHDSLAAVEPDAHRVVTGSGATIEYDVLVVAIGARPEEALAGALTYRGSEDAGALSALLSDLCERRIRSVAFALPGAFAWPLPIYELALMTAGHLALHGVDDAELVLVTPEEAPLKIFGTAVSDEIATLLEQRGIEVRIGAYPQAVDGGLRLTPGGDFVAVDRVVAMPRLVGPAIAGLPHTADGFMEVDPHGRVRGVDDVFAAGDGTAFPIKQGGLAAQQADVVAEAIAARAGAAVDQHPFKPVLRGLLLTGGSTRFLRSAITGGQGESSVVADYALWWPPSKVVGRYLAPYLATAQGAVIDPALPEDASPIEVEVDLAEVGP